jgi:hypothetical protein
VITGKTLEPLDMWPHSTLPTDRPFEVREVAINGSMPLKGVFRSYQQAHEYANALRSDGINAFVSVTEYGAE